MDILEVLKAYFSDFIHHIDLLIEFFSGAWNGVLTFFTYIWFMCIPNEITDITYFFIMALFAFAFIKKSK